MSEIGAYEAKTHLPRLLEEVIQGEIITITRQGVPIAKLVPVKETSPLSRKEVIRKIKDFRKGKRLDGLSIREMIEEGRA